MKKLTRFYTHLNDKANLEQQIVDRDLSLEKLEKNIMVMALRSIFILLGQN